MKGSLLCICDWGTFGFVRTDERPRPLRPGESIVLRKKLAGIAAFLPRRLILPRITAPDLVIDLLTTDVVGQEDGQVYPHALIDVPVSARDYTDTVSDKPRFFPHDDRMRVRAGGFLEIHIKNAGPRIVFCEPLLLGPAYDTPEEIRRRERDWFRLKDGESLAISITLHRQLNRLGYPIEDINLRARVQALHNRIEGVPPS